MTATHPSGSQIHHARPQRFDFTNNSSRTASHGSAEGTRLGSVHWQLTGTPSFAPRPPRSDMATIFSSPADVSGTRHEYEQVPLQPYANLPDAIFRFPL
jgi:hypothetical protein